MQLEWSKKCSALLRIPDEVPEESQVKFPDLMEEAGLLEWAGINMGKAEVYLLRCLFYRLCLLFTSHYSFRIVSTHFLNS